MHKSVGATAEMGPFYALLNQESILGEFVNAASDLSLALQGLDAAACKVRRAAVPRTRRVHTRRALPYVAQQRPFQGDGVSG